jgi:hypothetical protein
VNEALAGYEKDTEDLDRFLVKDLFSAPVQGQQKQGQFEERLAAYAAGVARLRSIVVEVSPSCDMFQGKLHVGRLVAGVLMPVNEVSKVLPLPKEPSIKVLGPITLGAAADDGPVHLVLNARYVSGCDPAKISSVGPIARLREQALHDVQAWMSGHGGRLGVLQVRGKAPG